MHPLLPLYKDLQLSHTSRTPAFCVHCSSTCVTLLSPGLTQPLCKALLPPSLPTAHSSCWTCNPRCLEVGLGTQDRAQEPEGRKQSPQRWSHRWPQAPRVWSWAGSGLPASLLTTQDPADEHTLGFSSPEVSPFSFMHDDFPICLIIKGIQIHHKSKKSRMNMACHSSVDFMWFSLFQTYSDIDFVTQIFL